MKHFSFPLVASQNGINTTFPFQTNLPVYISQLDQDIWSLYDYLYWKNPNYTIYNNKEPQTYYSDTELQQLGLIYKVKLLDDDNFKHLYVTIWADNTVVRMDKNKLLFDHCGQVWEVISQNSSLTMLTLVSTVPDTQVPRWLQDDEGIRYTDIKVSFDSVSCLMINAALLPLHKGLLNSYAAQYKDNVWLFFGDFEALIADRRNENNPTGLNQTDSGTPCFSKRQLREIETHKNHSQFYFFQWPEASLIISQASPENEENSIYSNARRDIKNYFLGRLSSLNSYYTVQIFNYNQTSQLLFAWTEKAEGSHTNEYSFHLYPMRIAHSITDWPTASNSICLSSLRSIIGTYWTYAEPANHKLYLKNRSTTQPSLSCYDEIISDDTFSTSHQIEHSTWRSLYNITWPSVSVDSVYYHIY